MAELAQVTDVQAKGIDRLLEQYKGKININTLLDIYLEQVQELEDVTWDVMVKRALAVATDAQLEVLGAIVGQPNWEGWTTEQFRTWIGVRIRLNQSFGTAVDIIECIQLATDAEFRYVEYTSAALLVEFEELPEFVTDIMAIVHLASAAGVNVTVLFPPADGPGFRFKNDTDTDDPDKGYADGSV